MTYSAAPVQSATFSGAPPTVTWPHSYSAGSYLVAGHLLVCTVFDTTTTTQPTVSDSFNGAWTLMNSNVLSSRGVWEFAVLSAGVNQPSTITVSQGSDTLEVEIEEWSGNFASLAGIKDQAGGGNGTAATTSGDGATITVAGAYSTGDLVRTSIGWANTVTSPVTPTGFTQGAAPWPTGSIRAATYYQVATAPGTFTPVVAWTTSRAFVHLVTSYLAFALAPVPATTIVATSTVRATAQGIGALPPVTIAAATTVTGSIENPQIQSVASIGISSSVSGRLSTVQGHPSSQLGGFQLGAAQLGGSSTVPASTLPTVMIAVTSSVSSVQPGAVAVFASTAAIAVVSTVTTGPLKAVGPLPSATIAAASTVTGTLIGTGRLTASITASTTIIASATGAGRLSAAVTSTTSMVATLGSVPLVQIPSATIVVTTSVTSTLTAQFVPPPGSTFYAVARQTTFYAVAA